MSFRPVIRPVARAVARAVNSRTGFSPLELFAQGEQGVWYDPSDLTTLYQDAAGTIPVTADGDPVGRMEDKSGNAKHATQSVAASRPVYKTDGTLHWLAADGADDYLVLSKDILDVTKSQTAFFGASIEDGAATSYLLGTTPIDKGFEFLTSTSTEQPRPAVITESGVIVGNDPTPMADGQPIIFTQGYNRTSGRLTLRRDGAETVSVSGTPANVLTPTTDYELFSAAAGSGGRCWPGNLYGLVLVSKDVSAGERSSAESFMAAKTGVVL